MTRYKIRDYRLAKTYQNQEIDGRRTWHIGATRHFPVTKMLQHLFEFDCEIDRQEGTGPKFSTQVKVWDIENSSASRD